MMGELFAQIEAGPRLGEAPIPEGEVMIPLSAVRPLLAWAVMKIRADYQHMTFSPLQSAYDHAARGLGLPVAERLVLTERGANGAAQLQLLSDPLPWKQPTT